MADSKGTHTHTAFTVQRTGKKLGQWLAVGSGRIDQEGVHVFLDRLPVGGFTGYIRLIPNGAPPPVLESVPQRPSTSAGDDGDDDF